MVMSPLSYLHSKAINHSKSEKSGTTTLVPFVKMIQEFNAAYFCRIHIFLT